MPLADGAVGFDRARLEQLRAATEESWRSASAVGSSDWLATETMASLRATIDFLAGPMRRAIDEMLLTDSFTRSLDGSGNELTAGIGWFGRLLSALPIAEFTGESVTTGLEDIASGDLIAMLITRVGSEHAASDLDHPFWSGDGHRFLIELGQRIQADDTFLTELLDAPAGHAIFAMLLTDPPMLQSNDRFDLAMAVLTTRFPDSIVDTELAERATTLAARTITSDGDLIDRVLYDADLLHTVVERGHISNDVVGSWLATSVGQLADNGWPDGESIDLLQSLSRFAALEPFGDGQPPSSFAIPTASLVASTMPQLAAGRTPSGSYLYPPIRGDRSADEHLEREQLRELIGLAVRDADAAVIVFTGLRTALREAAAARSADLDVIRVDEIARIVDEAIRHEDAEIEALRAAQAQWVSTIIGGLDRVVSQIGKRLGPVVQQGGELVVDGIRGAVSIFVDIAGLPFDSTRSYYEMSRTFEIRRRAVMDAAASDATGPELDRAMTALDLVDGRLDADIDGSSHDVNVAWLDFEDTSSPFVDLSRFAEVRW